jgi:hypothetical protein
MKNIREEIKIKGNGGVYDLFDNVIKGSFNITDEEYDYIAGEASDEDLSIFIDGIGGFNTPSTFGDKRRALEVRDKYLKMFRESKVVVYNPNLCACNPDNGGDGTCQCD